MKRPRYSDDQIAYALRQAESGTGRWPISARQRGISEATFYVWKKHFGHMGVADVRDLGRLRVESCKLKHLVADLTLYKHILTEMVREKV
jgi:putative transposase